MKISILCSSTSHPIYPWLERWKVRQQDVHEVELVQDKLDLSGGDILFLISCHQLVDMDARNKYRETLVIHASDLPKGKGWSPHIWQILEGKNEIVVTLLEAEDQVDSGRIWEQRVLTLEGHELFDEINRALFQIELDLMDFAVESIDHVFPRLQKGGMPTYYRKRTREDSQLDPFKTIAEQFDLLRVADPERYPAFFEYRGHCYMVRIDKVKDPNNA